MSPTCRRACWLAGRRCRPHHALGSEARGVACVCIRLFRRHGHMPSGTTAAIRPGVPVLLPPACGRTRFDSWHRSPCTASAPSAARGSAWIDRWVGRCLPAFAERQSGRAKRLWLICLLSAAARLQSSPPCSWSPLRCPCWSPSACRPARTLVVSCPRLWCCHPSSWICGPRRDANPISTLYIRPSFRCALSPYSSACAGPHRPLP